MKKATEEEIKMAILEEEIALEDLDEWMVRHGYESVLGDVSAEMLQDDSEITYYSQDGMSQVTIGYQDYHYSEDMEGDVFWVTSVYMDEAEG